MCIYRHLMSINIYNIIIKLTIKPNVYLFVNERNMFILNKKNGILKSIKY
jgi:hypothetical protein